MTTAVRAAKQLCDIIVKKASEGSGLRKIHILPQSKSGEFCRATLCAPSLQTEMCNTQRFLTGHSIKRRSNMGPWRNWERNSLARKRLRVQVPSVPPKVNGFVSQNTLIIESTYDDGGRALELERRWRLLRARAVTGRGAPSSFRCFNTNAPFHHGQVANRQTRWTVNPFFLRQWARHPPCPPYFEIQFSRQNASLGDQRPQVRVLLFRPEALAIRVSAR